MNQSKDCNYFQFTCSPSQICLVKYKKQIKQKTFSRFLEFFFATTSNASPLSYAIQSEDEARVDGTEKCVLRRALILGRHLRK